MGLRRTTKAGLHGEKNRKDQELHNREEVLVAEKKFPQVQHAPTEDGQRHVPPIEDSKRRSFRRCLVWLPSLGMPCYGMPCDGMPCLRGHALR